MASPSSPSGGDNADPFLPRQVCWPPIAPHEKQVDNSLPPHPLRRGTGAEGPLWPVSEARATLLHIHLQLDWRCVSQTPTRAPRPLPPHCGSHLAAQSLREPWERRTPAPRRVRCPSAEPGPAFGGDHTHRGALASPHAPALQAPPSGLTPTVGRGRRRRRGQRTRVVVHGGVCHKTRVGQSRRAAGQVGAAGGGWDPAQVCAWAAPRPS